MCALLALFAAPVAMSAAGIAERFLDPYSPYCIEREARDTVEWMQGMVRRALLERRDFVFEIYGQKPNPRIRAKWTNPPETVEWNADRIAYQVEGRTNAVEFRYSHRYQTMSPAFELNVFTQTPEINVMKRTEWGIVVSLYGLTRLSRQGE